MGGRAHPGLGFCQGAMTKERKAELLREFTLWHLGQTKQQRLDREERKRLEEAWGRVWGLQSSTETKEWATGSLSCRAGRMGRGAGNPDLRARGMRGPRYDCGKGLPGPQRREGYGAT